MPAITRTTIAIITGDSFLMSIRAVCYRMIDVVYHG